MEGDVREAPGFQDLEGVRGLGCVGKSASDMGSKEEMLVQNNFKEEERLDPTQFISEGRENKVLKTNFFEMSVLSRNQSFKTTDHLKEY